MNGNKETPHKTQEGIFTAISAGFFFLLVGIIFVITPNLFDAILGFFDDFGLVDVPNTSIMFFGPESPQLHLTVYQATGQLSIALAIFQVFMLALRFTFPSSLGKRAETMGNLVYWAGAAFLLQSLAIETTQQWFAFWSAILIVAGISLIARAAVTVASRI